MIIGAVAQASGPGRAIINRRRHHQQHGRAGVRDLPLVVTSNVLAPPDRRRFARPHGELRGLERQRRSASGARQRVHGRRGRRLDTNMALLRTGGPLTIPQRDRSSSRTGIRGGISRLGGSAALDQPLRIYSTDSAADVARNMQDVAHAGIDAVIVGQQRGRRRLKPAAIALRPRRRAAGRPEGDREPRDAGRQPRRTRGRGTRPDVLTAWIVELVDTLATHPAAEGGRPPRHPRLRLGYAGETPGMRC
jgi:hypothetical protein